MVRRDDGAWNACCNRLGYWIEGLPLPHDRWYPTDTYFMGQRAFTLCRTSKWPRGQVPCLPVLKEEENMKREMYDGF